MKPIKRLGRLAPIRRFRTRNGLHPKNVTGVNGLSFSYGYRERQHYWVIALFVRRYDAKTGERATSSYFIHDLGLREAWDRAVRFLEHGAQETIDKDYLEEAYVKFRKYYLARVNKEHRQYADKVFMEEASPAK